MKPPFFSVVIPVFNRENFILTSIRSVLNQTFENFELIVINDGSTDDTAKKVVSVKDNRMVYVYQDNQERGVARNHGIELARGQYITFLDSDDLYYNFHLEKAFQTIKKFREPEWVHMPYEIIDENRKLIRKVRINRRYPNEQLLKGNPLSCHGMFVRKDIITDNKFREDRQLAGSEDWELWMRLAVRFPLKIGEGVTNALVQNENRSVINQDQDKLIARIFLVEKYVWRSMKENLKWKNKKGVMKGHLMVYLSLHLAMMKLRKKSFIYLLIALIYNPKLALDKKSFAIIKKIMTLKYA